MIFPVTISVCYYNLTHSTQHSPSWEANNSSTSQEIRRISWNPKLHCCIHKWSPPFPILSQPNPVHTPTSTILKIQLHIILPSMPGSPQWSLSLMFPHQNPVCTPPLQTRGTWPAHFNIILPSKPGSPQWSLSLRFPHQNPVYTSLLPHTWTHTHTHILLHLCVSMYIYIYTHTYTHIQVQQIRLTRSTKQYTGQHK